MNKTVFITKKILQSGIDLLNAEGFNCVINDSDQAINLNNQKYLDTFKTCDALIATVDDKFDKEFLKNFPRLKIIANYAVGTNNIDLNYAQIKNIAVTNTPDVLTNATAELALTLLMVANRDLKNAMLNVDQNQWKSFNPHGFLGPELEGKTLGVFCLGPIGQKLAKMCQQAFNMNIIYHGFSGEKKLPFNARHVEFNELLQESDFLSLHCKLSPETKHLFNYQKLSLMKANSILINTSRGDVINEHDLYKILNEKKIRSAAIDVCENEPLAMDSQLRNLSNIIITPHIGSATWEARSKMSTIAATNIINYFKGQQLISPVI